MKASVRDMLEKIQRPIGVAEPRLIDVLTDPRAPKTWPAGGWTLSGTACLGCPSDTDPHCCQYAAAQRLREPIRREQAERVVTLERGTGLKGRRRKWAFWRAYESTTEFPT